MKIDDVVINKVKSCNIPTNIYKCSELTKNIYTKLEIQNIIKTLGEEKLLIFCIVNNNNFEKNLKEALKLLEELEIKWASGDEATAIFDELIDMRNYGKIDYSLQLVIRPRINTKERFIRYSSLLTSYIGLNHEAEMKDIQKIIILK